jgi:transglutaminase-like putative cysteine protease
VLYDIGLRIGYEYDSPAIAGRQTLRLTPANIPGEQRVIASYLEIAPKADERTDRTDFFGNTALDVAFRSPHAEIELKLNARVERLARPPLLDVSPKLVDLPKDIEASHELGAATPHHFVGPTPRVRLSPTITDFAREHLASGTSTLQTVETLSLAVHRAMRFDAKATNVDTPPEEAFARRHGVCQDFTHILIAALRGVGIPAGYVSGFLRTIPPAGKARLEGADAMHAWARAWCGIEAGWIEIDPTNAIRVGTDHIVVAYGRDYADVAPVKGVLRTAGTQTTKQAVDVKPLET